MKIKPLGHRIVVQKVKAEQTTASGLVLPESAQEKEQQGEVVAVSALIQDLKVGDKVIYAEYGGTQLTIDNAEYTILDMKDVLALIE